MRIILLVHVTVPFNTFLVSLKRRADALELQFEAPSSKPEENPVLEKQIVEDAFEIPAPKFKSKQEDKTTISERVPREKQITSASVNTMRSQYEEESCKTRYEFIKSSQLRNQR